jgi:hypothetical protein
MYTAIVFLIKLLLVAGAAAYSAFVILKKERIFKPKPREKPREWRERMEQKSDTEVTLAEQAEQAKAEQAEVDEEFMSGQESKLAHLLTVLCLGVYRFYAVPQGFTRVVTLFGKFEQVSAEPGLYGCWSFWNFYHVPSAPILLKEQVIRYATQRVYTKDGNECYVKMAVYVTIHDVEKVVFAVADHWAAILALVDSVLRNECGDLPARELLASRKKLAQQLKSQLDVGAAPWGIHVRLVEITDIGLNTRQHKSVGEP